MKWTVELAREFIDTEKKLKHIWNTWDEQRKKFEDKFNLCNSQYITQASLTAQAILDALEQRQESMDKEEKKLKDTVNREKAEELSYEFPNVGCDDYNTADRAEMINLIEKALDEKDKAFQVAREMAISEHNGHDGGCRRCALYENICIDEQIEKRLKG